MFTKLDFFIAFRYLKSKKSESFISVVSIFSLMGISLGVAALIVVMAVMNGFRIELTSKIVGFEGDIAITSSEDYIYDYQKYVSQIKDMKEIKHVFPLIQNQGLISTNNNASLGVKINALAPQDVKNKTLISENIIAGDLKDFESNYTVIIGSSLAYKLKLFIGDEIKIISPQITTTIVGRVPRFKTFKVIGIFSSGMSEYDNVSIFINLDSAQKFYKYTDSVNVIEIHSFDPQKSDITKLKIADLLEHKLMVTDWKTRSKEFFESLKTERVVMFIILTLIILVAAFNIISSLIMLVKDKTTDVGILRTIGASRASIIKIFFICGSSLGISGTFIGVCLGVSFAANIEKIKSFLESITNVTLFNPLVYYLSHLPSHIEPSDIYKIAFLSLTLSLSATIYPAWRASSINPIDALRS